LRSIPPSPGRDESPVPIYCMERHGRRKTGLGATMRVDQRR
jgi:hypothetical protein